MYIDLSIRLSNPNSFVILFFIATGTGYLVNSINGHGVVKLGYSLTLIAYTYYIYNPLVSVVIGAGFIFGYFYAKGSWSLGDWLRVYRYNLEVNRDERERLKREKERQRRETEETRERQKEESQRRREEQEQRRREEDERKRKKDQGGRKTEPGREYKEGLTDDEIIQRIQEELRKILEERDRKEKANEKEKKPDPKPEDKRTAEEILGLGPLFTYEELRKAYKVECQRLHPDKWQNRPEHIRQTMEEELKRVIWAFGVLEKRFR